MIAPAPWGGTKAVLKDKRTAFTKQVHVSPTLMDEFSKFEIKGKTTKPSGRLTTISLLTLGPHLAVFFIRPLKTTQTSPLPEGEGTKPER